MVEIIFKNKKITIQCDPTSKDKIIEFEFVSRD